jgi:hypothetical protein
MISHFMWKEVSVESKEPSPKFPHLVTGKYLRLIVSKIRSYFFLIWSPVYTDAKIGPFLAARVCKKGFTFSNKTKNKKLNQSIKKEQYKRTWKIVTKSIITPFILVPEIWKACCRFRSRFDFVSLPIFLTTRKDQQEEKAFENLKTNSTEKKFFFSRKDNFFQTCFRSFLRFVFVHMSKWPKNKCDSAQFYFFISSELTEFFWTARMRLASEASGAAAAFSPVPTDLRNKFAALRAGSEP